MDGVSLTNWVKFGQYQLSVSSQFNLCTGPVQGTYMFYIGEHLSFRLQFWSKVERRTHFGKFLKDFAGRAENFQILLRGRVECCLFTPWESNLFVTHNQYPAKNHHLRQNQRFSPAKNKFKKNIQIVAQNTFAPDSAAGIVKPRQQVAIFLLTWHQLKKTCNLPSSSDNVRFCNLFAWRLWQV